MRALGGDVTAGMPAVMQQVVRAIMKVIRNQA
jgi:hypothetical protein